MDAILDNCRHGNTIQYLIKWAVPKVSTPGKVTWSGSTVILSYPSSDAVDSCIRLLCLHSTLRWQILHALLTAPWSLHCPVTPAKHCTWKTPSQTSRWSCQSSSCHMALTTESPWPASLILTHGTMCTTLQIPQDLNGHGSASQTAFQFSYHTTRNHLMVTFRPSLKTFTGRLMMTHALPACGLARPGDVAAGQGNTIHMAPSQSKRDLVESFFVHCNLPANGHVIGNARNCLLRTVPVKGYFGDVMCYEPQWLDWLPVCWTELKHVHMVITDGHGQKVPFEGWTCSVKLLLRQRGSYLRIWKKRLTSSSWWPSSHHTPALGTCEVMALSASSKGCSIRPSLCPRARAAGQCAPSRQHVPRKDH